MCIYSHRQGDTILFHHQGGVDIGDVDAKAKTLLVAIDHTPTVDELKSKLLTEVAADKKEYAKNSIIVELERMEFHYFQCMIMK